jgi:hypothetical protein
VATLSAAQDTATAGSIPELSRGSAGNNEQQLKIRQLQAKSQNSPGDLQKTMNSSSRYGNCRQYPRTLQGICRKQ